MFRRTAALVLMAVLSAATLGGCRRAHLGQPGSTGAAAADPRFANPARCAFVHHELDAALDPATGELQATDQMLILHPPGVAAERKVPFLLNRSLDIASIQAGAAITWSERPQWEPCDFWAHPEYAELSGYDHARQVDLFLNAGDVWPESLLVEVSYAGVLYDSLKPPPENYQRGFETSTGLIDPRGAFLASSSLWYPEHFDGGFTFRLATTVPAEWLTVSQGDRLASGWRSPQPMDEIYLIAGPYRLLEEQHRGVAIQTFTYGNDDAQLCRRYLDATRDYLDLYSDLIGPYPFGKFALVENFWQTGYGMPSFTLLGDRVIRLPFIVHTSYGHEILHNWWGNGVFVDASSGNWCEGITVYGADYLYKERESEAAARDYRRTQLQGYLDYARAGQDFPLTEFRSRHDASSAAVGYGKSMMIFHMLRQRLGDERFWRALSVFYERYLFQQASWDDLLEVFSAQGAGDLRGYHEQWLARSGAPVLRLVEPQRRPAGDGYAVSYALEQDAPFYELTVPMRATFADRPPEQWSLELHRGRREETRSFAGPPLTLEADPEFDIFRRLHRAEIPTALSQVFGAESLTVVVAAGAAPALGDLAGKVQRQAPATILSDADIGLEGLRRGGAWIMGEPRWSARLAPLMPSDAAIGESSFTIGGEEFDRAGHTLVLALPNPANADEALGVLLGESPDDLPGVWRKLPHYGKYSYLVFAGTRNVAKGNWPVGSSPLKFVWEE